MSTNVYVHIIIGEVQNIFHYEHNISYIGKSNVPIGPEYYKVTSSVLIGGKYCKV